MPPLPRSLPGYAAATPGTLQADAVSAGGVVGDGNDVAGTGAILTRSGREPAPATSKAAHVRPG
jgi:hypothetical protein